MSDANNSLRRIMSGLGHLHERVADEQFVDILKELLVAELNPDNIVMLAYYPDQAPDILFQWIPNPKVNAFFSKIYSRELYLLDPFYCKAIAGFDTKAYQLKDIAPDHFRRSAYYKQYFQKADMLDEIGCFAALSEDVTVELSLGRNFGSHSFNKEEFERFDVLVSALCPMVKSYSKPRIKKSTIHSLRMIKKLSEKVYLDNGAGLTKRESEIIAFILQGHSSLSISLNLDISVATVKVHRKNTYRKLSISSQAQLFSLYMHSMFAH